MTPLCKFCGGTDIIIVKLSSVFLIYRDMCYPFFFPLRFENYIFFFMEFCGIIALIFIITIQLYNYNDSPLI
jgi:hypothetical protein